MSDYHGLNPLLVAAAQSRLRVKSAAQAPPMDPGMAGGAPPGMPPGAPPMDPAMDPAMAGGMPPPDPTMAPSAAGPPMAAGAPPMDPAMAGMPSQDPNAAAAGGAPKMSQSDRIEAMNQELKSMAAVIRGLAGKLDVQVPAAEVMNMAEPSAAMPAKVASHDPLGRMADQIAWMKLMLGAVAKTAEAKLAPAPPQDHGFGSYEAEPGVADTFDAPAFSGRKLAELTSRAGRPNRNQGLLQRLGRSR